MELLAIMSKRCTTWDLEALETLGHDRQLILFFLSFFLSSGYLYGYETLRFNGPDDLVIKHSDIPQFPTQSHSEVLLLFPSPPCAKLTLTSFLSAILTISIWLLIYIVRCYISPSTEAVVSLVGR